MSQDTSFELKLAQLADARLQEKVPSLFPSRVGFQLIDKSDDDTRGTGVMGFIVDGMWIYVPVCFIKGRLKGLDMMYIKNIDMMCPLNDSWISYVKKGKIRQLGDSVPREDVKARKPDMIHIMLAPHEKISCEVIIDTDTLSKMSAQMSMPPSRDFIQDLAKLGGESVYTLFRKMDQDSQFANAVLKYHHPETLRKAAKEGSFNPSSSREPARSKIEQALTYSRQDGSPVVETKVVLKAPEAKSDDGPKLTTKGSGSTPVNKETMDITSLKVIKPCDSEDVEELSDSDKEVLMRDGVFIKDDRTETTQVYRSGSVRNDFVNPTESGIYDVLMSTGKCLTMLVVFPDKVKTSESSYSHSAVKPNNPVCLINPADPAKYLDFQASEILVRPTSSVSEEIYEQLGKAPKLTRSAYLDLSKESYLSVLVVDNRKKAYMIGVSNALDGRGRYIKDDVLPLSGCSSGMSIQFHDQDGKLHVNHDRVHVPSSCVYFVPASYSVRESFRPGSINTLIYSMGKEAGLSSLKIYSDHGGYAISSDSKQKFGLTKTAAVLHLVSDYGISAPSAKLMVSESSDKQGFAPKSNRYMLKVAERYSLQTAQPGSGSRRVFSQAPLETNNELMPARALEAAVKASDSGVKEVMDVSILAGLASSKQSLEMIGEYVGDLIKAMDRLGRMLFLFYWRNEDFKDHYGQQDLIKLEDSLRDVFSSTGDLIIFLREKSVDFDTLFSSNKQSVSDDLGNME